VPKLAIRRGDTFDREVDLNALKDKPLKLGRGEQNDIVLPDPTKAVSRFHAELRREGAKFILEDRDSQNGLWVAGRRQQRVTLESGVPVTVGSYTVMLVTTASEMAGPVDTEGPTLVRKGAAVAGAAPGPAGPSAAAPTKPRPAAPVPIPAASGGTRKALVFGGFAAVVVLVIALVQVLGPANTKGGGVATGSNEQPTPPPPAAPDAPKEAPKTEPPPAPAEPPATPAPENTPKPDAPKPETVTKADPVKNVVRLEKSSDKPVDKTPPKPAPNPREREFADRYDRAKAALGRDAYSEAIPLLTELQRDQPGYRDVPTLLMQAKDGVAAQARGAAEQAARLEASGDLTGALQQNLRAQQIDPSMSGIVEPAIRRVRERMKSEGSDALKQAKTYDAFGQAAKAIPLYEKAYRYLPEDDADRKAAKERLDVLRAKK